MFPWYFKTLIKVLKLLIIAFEKQNYQNNLIHISELRTNSTLINYVIKVYELKRKPLGPIGQY